MDQSLVYVLIQTTADKTLAVQDAISQIEGVESAHAVTGPYDIIVLIKGEDPQKIGALILNKIRLISGIVQTLTCVVVG